jgi:uncharacterized membrane protein YdjX (TVP38/TMEM64 family)
MFEMVMSAPTATASRARLARAIAAVGLVVGGILAARALPLDRHLLGVVDWIRDAGVAGAAVFVLVYVLATVLFLPGSILTLGAGFAYGVVVGTVVVWIASNFGAALAFVLGRTLARDWVAAKVAGNTRFAALDRAVGQQGLRIVLLTRLSPVFPFNLLNYAYGLTRVRFRDYLTGNLVGMLPGTVMYVYFGSLVTNLTELSAGKAAGGAAGQAAYFAGLAVAVGTGLYIARVARNALASAAVVTGTATGI